MTDPIRAALITGGVQIFAAALTFTVAVIAFGSWRRTALGERQIELAEQCLQAVWQLEKDIRSARLVLPPHTLDDIQNNPRSMSVYVDRHTEASAKIFNCLAKAKELSELTMLAEFYLGTFPTNKDTKVFRIMTNLHYRIDQEFIEISECLSGLLYYMHPDVVSKQEQTQNTIEDYDNSANLYYSFLYEYEEDYLSVRIRNARIALERHLRAALRRRSRIERYSDKIRDRVSDNIQRKFVAAKVNKFAKSDYGSKVSDIKK